MYHDIIVVTKRNPALRGGSPASPPLAFEGPLWHGADVEWGPPTDGAGVSGNPSLRIGESCSVAFQRRCGAFQGRQMGSLAVSAVPPQSHSLSRVHSSVYCTTLHGFLAPQMNAQPRGERLPWAVGQIHMRSLGFRWLSSIR